MPEGQRVAVVLSFTLPSSTYATMLLRELTKQSTDIESQKQLNLQPAAEPADEPAEETPAEAPAAVMA